MKLEIKSFKEKFKDKSRDEILEEMFEVFKEKEKLERELKKYKNSNTPSSANKHIKENTLGMKVKIGAKRGAPNGHYARTLHLPDPEEIIPLSAKQCCKCKGHNVVPTGYTKKRKVICLQKPKMIVKEYLQEEVRCIDCNSLTLANNSDIPEKGIYHKSIQSLVNYLKFKARLSHALVVDAMRNIFQVPMTEPTSLDITRRASDKLEPLYHDMEIQIRKEEIINADETSLSVNGVNNWIWVFCNRLFSLFKIQKERGGKIVEETLGKDFKGKLISDGWITYVTYTKENNVVHQRCWDHIRREVKYECKEKHPKLYNWCCDIYFKVKKGKDYKQQKRREDMFKKCKSELAMLMGFMKAHKNLRKLATKIENGGDNWFMAILYPELPIDNNEAERSLRPFVIIRKIIGCLRSEMGRKNYEIMMSLISTWQKQGKNTFYMLENTL